MLLPPFKRQLLPYAIVVLFAFIGFSLPLPILPEMFLDPTHSILPSTYSIEKKMMILGFLMTCYPLGQLIGSPLFGRLSDRFGRKKIILISLLGTTLGYVLTASSVSLNLLSGIFAGLLLCGFFEGNIAIAQAVIADLTRDENPADKIFHFGWINLFVCVGFILGPLLGGILADPRLVSWFTFATPFWIAALMTVIGIVIIYFGSKETKVFSLEKPEPFLKGQIALLLKQPLQTLYLANFFISLAVFSFFRFFPVYLERVFNFTPSELAYVMVYNSIAFALCILFFAATLSKKISSWKAAIIFTPLLGIMFMVIAIPSSFWTLLYILPIVGGLLALTLTNASVLVSNAASHEGQGQAMGTLTSVQVLAELLAAIIGAAAAAILPSLALIFGGIMALIATLILYVKRERTGGPSVQK